MAKPSWYDVLLVRDRPGMNFGDNGWSRCGIVEGSEQPPFCECLCTVD